MKHVSLQSVTMQNFKSFAAADIGMHRDPGLRMIFGENRREPRLGSNGVGKSSVWDAVEFCLSGRSVRGKRASDLVTTGQKSMSVETTWLIDDAVRKVKRSYQPERVYVDGALSEQHAVDELMGMSRDRRLASVIFGQAKPLFIDLPVPERGDLLDDVLNLGYWIRAADLATAKWNAAGVEMQRFQREIARLDGALSELPSDASLVQAVDAFDARRIQQIEELHQLRRSLDREYRDARRALAAVKVDVDRKIEVESQQAALNRTLSNQKTEIAVLDRDLEQLLEQINFFDESEECPVCGQAITEQFADEHKKKLGDAYDEKYSDLRATELDSESTIARQRELSDEIKYLTEMTREQYRLGLDVASKKSEVSIVDNRIRVLEEQVNPHEEQLRTVSARRAELCDKIVALRSDESGLSVRIAQLDFWRQGFRRVRVYCLTRVLAELEVETMSAARSLGLVGWSIKFSGETETKSGTVRLGIQAVVQSPGAKRDFDAFSPGEGQRIRCATALGLASLIQRHSGVSYDLEVWDEPSAWLSSEGIDDLFECLRERAYARGKSIWICDPRAGIAHGGFDEIWNVIKDDGGSCIEVVGAVVVA